MDDPALRNILDGLADPDRARREEAARALLVQLTAAARFAPAVHRDVLVSDVAFKLLEATRAHRHHDWANCAAYVQKMLQRRWQTLRQHAARSEGFEGEPPAGIDPTLRMAAVSQQDEQKLLANRDRAQRELLALANEVVAGSLPKYRELRRTAFARMMKIAFERHALRDLLVQEQGQPFASERDLERAEARVYQQHRRVYQMLFDRVEAHQKDGTWSDGVTNRVRNSLQLLHRTVSVTGDRAPVTMGTET